MLKRDAGLIMLSHPEAGPHDWVRRMFEQGRMPEPTEAQKLFLFEGAVLATSVDREGVTPGHSVRCLCTACTNTRMQRARMRRSRHA